MCGHVVVDAMEAHAPDEAWMMYDGAALHSPTVGSYGGAVSYERGTPVRGGTQTASRKR